MMGVTGFERKARLTVTWLNDGLLPSKVGMQAATLAMQRCLAKAGGEILFGFLRPPQIE